MHTLLFKVFFSNKKGCKENILPNGLQKRSWPSMENISNSNQKYLCSSWTRNSQFEVKENGKNVTGTASLLSLPKPPLPQLDFLGGKKFLWYPSGEWQRSLLVLLLYFFHTSTTGSPLKSYFNWSCLMGAIGKLSHKYTTRKLPNMI